jgi:hypothetical protein
MVTAMRKLTDTDLTNIAGSTIKGYHIEGVRVKRGPYIDSDHYGFVLGRNANGHYVTWQFHLDEDEKPNVYWGHYHIEKREAAIRDFETRDLDDVPDVDDSAMSGDSPRMFKVRITETLQKMVTIEAKSRDEAEQIISDRWRNGEYVLGADDFTGMAEFTAWEGEDG